MEPEFTSNPRRRFYLTVESDGLRVSTLYGKKKVLARGILDLEEWERFWTGWAVEQGIEDLAELETTISFLCSSSLDFPQESTHLESVHRLCDFIREVDREDSHGS